TTGNLTEYGERLYDHVFLAPGATALAASVFSPVQFGEFVNLGGNLLVVVDSAMPAALRQLAIEFSLEFDDSGTLVMDPLNALDPADPTRFRVAPSQSRSRHVTGSMAGPAVFRGIGHRLTGKNPFTFPVLSAHPAAYSDFETPAAAADGAVVLDPGAQAGATMQLVSGFQARNNARILFAGSMELFSDAGAAVAAHADTASTPPNANAALAQRLAAWTFQAAGVLRIERQTHHLANETVPRGEYRIGSDLTYELDVGLWRDGRWQPFDADVIQFEAKMLEVYVRLPMARTAQPYAVTTRLPWKDGIYTFAVAYYRPGLSYVVASEQVVVRPYRHNEHENRISIFGLPHYVNFASMMLAFVLFSLVYLYHQD
ncbi:hypothetical protein CXG81DRAFT_3970, partial [Caulochytrium protostelioides]